MIAIASDHVGFALKKEIMAYLSEQGIAYKDFGTFDEQRCHYPEYVLKAAIVVKNKECERGILFCGTGIGVSIAANKMRGIRCVVCSEPYSALLSRQHNDTNMLAIGSRVVGADLARMFVENWLCGIYEGGRHATRVKQIAQLEETQSIISCE